MRFLLKSPGETADKGLVACRAAPARLSEASANGATFVDTFTPSIGHDACKSTSVRWVNPIIATNGGISVHPDPTGEAEMALFVESALAG